MDLKLMPQHQYRIKVSNIANSASDDEVFTFFKQIGPINLQESKVERSIENGNNKTMAQIVFYDQESVYIAEKFFQKYIFKDRPLIIQILDNQNQKNNLYFNNFGDQTLKNLSISKQLSLIKLFIMYMNQNSENKQQLYLFLQQHKSFADQFLNMLNYIDSNLPVIINNQNNYINYNNNNLIFQNQFSTQINQNPNNATQYMYGNNQQLNNTANNQMILTGPFNTPNSIPNTNLLLTQQNNNSAQMILNNLAPQNCNQKIGYQNQLNGLQ